MENDASIPRFVRFRGRVSGPFSHEEMLRMKARGQLTRIHEVSADGIEWMPARLCNELFAKAEVTEPMPPEGVPGWMVTPPKPGQRPSELPVSGALTGAGVSGDLELGMAPPSTPSHGRAAPAWLLWAVGGGALVIVAVIVIVAVAIRSDDGSRAPRGNPVFPDRNSTSGPSFIPAHAGISRESLKLASPQVRGSTLRVVQGSRTPKNWIGSACAVRQNGNRLLLATNAHVLGIEDMVIDASGRPMDAIILSYQLTVRFPSGKVKQVLRAGWEASRQKDLAFLEVDASELVEGIDYVVLPSDYGAVASPPTTVGLEPGDAVVAVGTPLDDLLAGTQTFGRISSVRHGGSAKVIQVDAAINGGNSGGPLFLEKDGRYYWIGINTAKWKELGVEGIGFAIAVEEFLKAQFEEFEPNKEGVASALVRRGHSAEAR